MIEPVLSQDAIALLCKLVDDGPARLDTTTDLAWFELLDDPRELVKGALKQDATSPGYTVGFATWSGKRSVIEWREHARKLLITL